MKNENIISFTKVSLPYGWLGNMSPYPIILDDKVWRTSEALFQSFRFVDDDIKEAIRAEKSPMGAKFVMNANEEHLIIEKHSPKDVRNMSMCLNLKLIQHPSLIPLLLATGDSIIVEDVTKRGDVGGNLFWGAMLVGDEWVGKNTLGNLWMEIRDEYKKK